MARRLPARHRRARDRRDLRQLRVRAGVPLVRDEQLLQLLHGAVGDGGRRRAAHRRRARARGAPGSAVARRRAYARHRLRARVWHRLRPDRRAGVDTRLPRRRAVVGHAAPLRGAGPRDDRLDDRQRHRRESPRAVVDCRLGPRAALGLAGVHADPRGGRRVVPVLLPRRGAGRRLPRRRRVLPAGARDLRRAHRDTRRGQSRARPAQGATAITMGVGCRECLGFS